MESRHPWGWRTSSKSSRRVIVGKSAFLYVLAGSWVSLSGSTSSLPKAVAKNKMGVVAKASATLGAKKIGVTIPGNMVVMVFHPKFAVRMLEASVPAGIEAPLRFYLTETTDGTTTLT